MKSIILLSLATLTAAISLAQSPATMLSQSRYRVESNGTSTLVDSIYHNHSSGMVSYALPQTELAYHPNDGVYKAYESVRVVNPQPSTLVDRFRRAFNSAGQITEYYEDIGNVAYTNVFKELYTYNSNSQLSSKMTYNGPDQSMATYFYQGTTLVAIHWDELDGTTWKPWAIDSFIANGTDSSYLTYAMQGSTMMLVSRHEYLRDANLRVLVDSFYPYSPMGRSVTYFDYDASGRKLRDSVFFGATLDYDFKTVYQYDNNGNLVTKIQYNWHQPTTTYKDTLIDSFTYNPVNQLTSVRSFKLVNDTARPALSTYSRFYHYGFPAGIPETAKNGSLKLYPIPAATHVTLDMSFVKPEAFSLSIYDMQGRVLRYFEEPAQPAYKKQIQLDGMPAGNYVLQVHSAGQSISKNFSIVN